MEFIVLSIFSPDSVLWCRVLCKYKYYRWTRSQWKRENTCWSISHIASTCRTIHKLNSGSCSVKHLSMEIRNASEVRIRFAPKNSTQNHAWSIKFQQRIQGTSWTISAQCQAELSSQPTKLRVIPGVSMDSNRDVVGSPLHVPSPALLPSYPARSHPALPPISTLAEPM